MMLMPKQKIAQVIVSGAEKLPDTPKESDLALEAAAQKVMSALESKDAKSFVAGLKDLMEMCEQSKET